MEDARKKRTGAFLKTGKGGGVALSRLPGTEGYKGSTDCNHATELKSRSWQRWEG